MTRRNACAVAAVNRHGVPPTDEDARPVYRSPMDQQRPTGTERISTRVAGLAMAPHWRDEPRRDQPRERPGNAGV
jgi:hypothetical protein